MIKAVVVSFLLFMSFATSANVVGSDAQNFNPTTSGLDFVTVHSSETLDPGFFNFGFFLNYAVNTLPYFPASGSATPQSRTNFNDSFFAGDFNVGYGLAKNWDVGMSLPVLLSQSVDNTENLALYEEGNTEVRLNTKYRLWGNDREGGAVIGTINFNRIENNPFAGSDAGPTVNVEFAVDKTIKKWAIAGNVGYRFRNSGTKISGITIDPMPNQFLLSAAASYLMRDRDLKLIVETFFSFPSNSDSANQTDRDLSSGELLVGIKGDFNRNLAWHAGAGTELYQGASSPDWRFYTGLNWNIGPRQKKKEPELRLIQEDQYEKLLLPDLFFEFGKSSLTKSSVAALKRVALRMREIIKKSKRLDKIEVEGHTDSIGSRKDNQMLSQKRADTVRDLLMSELRLSSRKVKSKGYGEDRPIADNGNFQGRAKNRRVEVKLFRTK